MLSQRRLANEIASVSRTLCRRGQSTLTSHRAQETKRIRRYKVPPGTIFVRPWDGISSTIEGLALIRGLERRYGPIQEYQLMRDPDHVEVMVPFFWATFKDASVTDRLPSQPHVIQLRVPRFDKTRPGGVSLDEMREYILSEDKVDDSANAPGVMERLAAEASSQGTSSTSEDSERIIDVRIEIADNKIRYKVGDEFPGMGKGRIEQIGKAFTAWGGFYEPPPNSQVPSVTSETPSDTPQPSYMAVAQQAWAKRFEPPSTKPEPEAVVEGEPTGSLESRPEEETPSEPDVELVDSHSLPTPEQSPRVQNVESIPLSPSSPPIQESIAPSESAPTKAQHPPTKSKAQSKKEQLLAQAREVARASYPPSIAEPLAEHQEQKDEQKIREAAAEREKVEAERFMETVKGRLRNIMGGRWY